MKKIYTACACSLLFAFGLAAQDVQDKGMHLYGHIRTDFFMQSRNSVNSSKDLFSLYAAPYGEQPSAGMHSVTTRIGSDFYTAGVLGANQALGKIEADFSGSSDNVLVRLRQAYVQLNWEHASLLLGQTWHPLSTIQIMPTTLNINIGSPYNPFNRSPQLRYQYEFQGWKATAAAIYQSYYKSNGPEGKSHKYQNDAMLPNLYIGIEKKLDGGYLLGLGTDFKALKPIESVNTLLYSYAGTAYAQYSKDLLKVSAKATYGQNLSEHNIICGYYIDRDNRMYNYQALAMYANAVYGKEHQLSMLAGYAVNLGAVGNIQRTGNYYGFGVSDDRCIGDMFRVSAAYMYRPNASWKFGTELEFNQATWCEMVLGRFYNPLRKNVVRLTAAVVYLF